MGISDANLLEPGPLTPDEREIMQETGSDVLKRTAAPMVGAL